MNRRHHVRRIAALCIGFILAADEHVLSQSGRYDLLVSSRSTNSVKRYDGETGAYLGDFILPQAGGLNSLNLGELLHDIRSCKAFTSGPSSSSLVFIGCKSFHEHAQPILLGLTDCHMRHPYRP